MTIRDKTLDLIGRERPLFEDDLATHKKELEQIVSDSRCLVIGGAGTIGQAVSREIFRRHPKALHVIDISENNLVELVRDIRSSLGYIDGDFQTLPLDVDSASFDAFARSQEPYDYILNLSALKHVRSEKDPFTLMRMINVNIFNAEKAAHLAAKQGAKKYFAVSTDKAANPVNLMGASKRIMEKFLARASHECPVSMARFANVAFSDGSLLHGFNQRILKQQPISAPRDVRRYFITPNESGELCLLSALLGKNRDIFFPKLDSGLNLLTFSEIAIRFLRDLGYEAVECGTEDEARSRVAELAPEKKWPVYFFDSDTTGEKPFEEFFMEDETLDMDSFQNVGVIKDSLTYDEAALERFEHGIRQIAESKDWEKPAIVELFFKVVPELQHMETGKYLDQRM